MVSGRLAPNVSGKIKLSNPAKTEETPNTTKGRACPKRPSTIVLLMKTKCIDSIIIPNVLNKMVFTDYDR